MKHGGLPWAFEWTGKKLINWMHLIIFKFWWRRGGMLRRHKALLKPPKSRNTVFKAGIKPRRKGRTRQNMAKNSACWPAWWTGRMLACTVTETKPHKAYSPAAQLLLSKQIPWSGIWNFFERSLYGINISTLSLKPPKIKPEKPHTYTENKPKILTAQVEHDSHPLKRPLLTVLSRSLLNRSYPTVNPEKKAQNPCK